MPTRKTKPKHSAVEMAIARTDWRAVAYDRDKEITELKDRLEAKEATRVDLEEARRRLVVERDGMATTIASQVDKINELQDARREALDLLRHVQAEALFWRGVAAGIDPDRAALAELARRGQRFGDLVERMDAGTDRRPPLMERELDKSARANAAAMLYGKTGNGRDWRNRT